MTIEELIAPINRRQDYYKTLALVEFQLRVLGLLCTAAAKGKTSLITPGTLDTWRSQIIKNSHFLNCLNCEKLAFQVAESTKKELAADWPVHRLRNQVFHGGPEPKGIDTNFLNKIVEENAKVISQIYNHGHITRLEPYFILINNELAALNDYSQGFATYWPRRQSAIDVASPEILDALHKVGTARSDRLLETFALDIQKDLRGFAEKDSIQTLVTPHRPIIVSWDLRTSAGQASRIDRFTLGADQERIWIDEEENKSYREFLAEICNWELLKKRLLEQLEERVESENRISQELFPELKRHVPDVAAMVHYESGPFGSGGNKPLAEICERITHTSNLRGSYTNLVTLTGEAGSGKTHGLLRFARESLSPGRGLTPLVFYFSSSGSSAKSLETLLDQVGGTRIVDRTSVLSLCRAGLAILVIDGFDELLGFRTYDTPLKGIAPILDELRGRGTVILSARSSYAEARLHRNLEQHDALVWQPYLTTLELLPWKKEQLVALTARLSPEKTAKLVPPEVRQLLTTPFFCLAFAAWSRSSENKEFLQSVVDTYLSRERRKIGDEGRDAVFNSITLANILSEAAEMAARNALQEISEEDLELAASQALDRDPTPQEKRRLVALCGMSAEWAEGELSFRFTHLALAEQFLARQIVRLPVRQSASLLSQVAISKLCARLVISLWRAEHRQTPVQLLEQLQATLNAPQKHNQDSPGAVSLGELWAKVHGSTTGLRTVRRIKVEELEINGPGRVNLQESHIESLILGPEVELLLTSSYVARIDLTNSSSSALIGDSYSQIGELLIRNEYATGPAQIKKALGLTNDTTENKNEIDAHFNRSIFYERRGIIVNQRDYTSEGDARLKWTMAYGLEAWQDYIRRMEAEGRIILREVVTGGPRKIRIRPTKNFYE